MSAAVAGSQRAYGFEALFRSEYARVVAVARRIVGDVPSAEDVAQEVFASGSQRLLADHRQAAAWLYATAVRRALNAVRRRDRRERRELQHSILQEPLRPSDGDPQHALDVAEVQAGVRRAMLRIPERSAMLLALRYGGCSHLEIAQTVGLPVEQVGTYLARAQRAFRKEFSDDARI